MPDRLTVVAAYNTPAEAELARNVLAEAGIPAVVEDSEIVAMDWLLTNAVGGVKVKVRAADADRAAELLDERLGAGLASDAIDEDELARQALAEAPEEPAPRGDPAVADAPPAAEPYLIDRDRYARNAFFTAWLAFLFPPLAVIGLYFWLCAAFGVGPITGRGRLGLVVAALILPFGVFFTSSFTGLLFGRL